MTEAGTKNPVDPTALLVSEALSELGWGIDAKTLAARIRQLQQGLPHEDEFMLLLSWLGKCRIVHKLDQFQIPPSSKGEIRIPDLLAVFDYNGRFLPVLIEVKATKRRMLSWRPDYFEGMRRYSDIMKLPLLLAWKWTESGLWTLCESSIFERPHKNYRLSFEKAITHSLMCELAGDFSYVFRKGVGLHFKLKKIKKGKSAHPSEETWRLKITDAYFTNDKGNHLNTLGPGIWWLFLGCDQETETDEKQDFFYHRFIINSESPMQAAHRLLTLVTAGLQPPEPVPWRKLLREHSFKIYGPELLQKARSAKLNNIMKYVFHLKPTEIPEFLKR